MANYTTLLAYPWKKVYYGKIDKPRTMSEEGKTPILFVNEYIEGDKSHLVYFTPYYAFMCEDCDDADILGTVEDVEDAIRESDILLNDYDDNVYNVDVIAYYDLEADTLVCSPNSIESVEIIDDIRIRMNAIFNKFYEIKSIEME